MIFPWPDGVGSGALACDAGNIVFFHDTWRVSATRYVAYYRQGGPETEFDRWLGRYSVVFAAKSDDIRITHPIPLLLTVLLPFAVAPFTRFRFSLWSYFAWTALIAAELTYYLR